MDNLTHTLIGALVGETAGRLAPSSSSRTALPADSRRAVGTVMMMIGSNLPDADFLYAVFTGNKLDYLLQHRGHTHTVLGAVAIAMLMFLATEAWLRRRRLQVSSFDRRYFAALALLAPLLHTAMDFTNSYGVHPFWPLYNGWLYGDAVFIVEPVFWVATAPLIFTLRSPLTRILAALPCAAAVALAFGSGLIPIPFALALTCILLALLWIGRTCASKVSLLAGACVWLLVTAGFFTASSIARTRTDTLLGQQGSGGAILDRVLTPMPVNPVCWEIMSVQTQDDSYLIRKAMLSLAPGWLPAARCPGRALGVDTTAPLLEYRAADTAQVRWLGEMLMSRNRLKKLTESSCQVAALMRFARVPWMSADATPAIVGDLRYDREPELGFAEVELGNPRPSCPRFVPAWLPPRADLLRDWP